MPFHYDYSCLSRSPPTTGAPCRRISPASQCLPPRLTCKVVLLHACPVIQHIFIWGLILCIGTVHCRPGATPCIPVPATTSLSVPDLSPHCPHPVLHRTMIHVAPTPLIHHRAPQDHGIVVLGTVRFLISTCAHVVVTVTRPLTIVICPCSWCHSPLGSRCMTGAFYVPG